MKKIITIIALITSVILNANETKEIQQIKQLFDTMSDKTVQIVTDKQNDKKQRNDKIVSLIEPYFDFELMAKISLGSKVYKQLTKQQLKKIVTLYVELKKSSYSSKMDLYEGEEIRVDNIKSINKGRYVLSSRIMTKKPVSMVYKYYTNTKNWEKSPYLIYDVEIDGVSIVKTDKNSYNEYIQKLGIEGFIEKLEEMKAKLTN